MLMSAMQYPLRVDANLEPQLSRWLWLVKWLLVIPHYVVLFFLWLAIFVLSLAAFVAILVTGSYPRSIFDFNVGVMRWTWRVTFYAYGGLGTDQYPPFSLEEVPDYPAHLEVAYPERLSRGLVLVKWWLLAIPHYLVIAFFVGGGWYATSSQDWQPPIVAGGLIGLLVLVAAVVLLFTGRYPQPIFDLVLGMNRWVLRVAAYVALMTDEYPPFRLDMGGPDPGDTQLAVPRAAAPPPATPSGAPAPPPERWGAGRVLAVVVGVLVLLLGGGLATAGATLGIAERVVRDQDGYLMSPSVTLASTRSALVSEDVQLTSGASTALPENLLGDGRLRVDAPRGKEVFVGVARSRDAAAYLTGVGYSRVVDPGGDGEPPTYQQHAGRAPATAPGEAGIWESSAQGTGRQSVTWPLREGSWTLVVMNADGSRGVAADVAVGATLPAATFLAVTLLVTGLVLLVVGVVVLVLAVRRRAR
jgi:hypothetical protein